MKRIISYTSVREEPADRVSKSLWHRIHLYLDHETNGDETTSVRVETDDAELLHILETQREINQYLNVRRQLQGVREGD